jgi:long-chain acyl-CoA synthetase
MSLANLGSMFKKTCEKYPEKVGYMFKKDATYQSLSFNEVNSRVNTFAAGLLTLNAKKGDTILLLSENRLEWAISDYAILSIGCITVPIYPTLLPNHIEFIINNSEGKILIVSNETQLDKISQIRSKIPNIKNIIIMEGNDSPDIISWTILMEKGKEKLQNEPDIIDKSLEQITREDLASIIYTSGTTGVPKGVMLTHGNFLSNIEGALEALEVTDEDVFLSFLPLSHVFERMAGHFLAIYAGATIAYAENIETVANNLKEVKPTVMTSVPRFFEKVYSRIFDSLEEGSKLKKKIFLWAIETGKNANIYYQKGLPLKGNLKRKIALADKLVFSKLKERVGGRIRLFASGGAPLTREIGEFFNAAGLPLMEVLTRGPHVMKGYFKNEEETQESIDKDNWLHTGDMGYIDKDGFLFITDRKKNILVTSGGKNIAPQPIENLLISSKYIDQALVIGDKRRYCTALIVPSMDNLKKYAMDQSIPSEDEKKLMEDSRIKQLIKAEIDNLSVNLASYETIKEFILLSEPFTIESGDLTPTLKIKRNVVEQRYQHLIDKMYKTNASTAD